MRHSGRRSTANRASCFATQASNTRPGLEDVSVLFAPPAPIQAKASPAAQLPTLALALPQNPAPEDLEAAGIAAFGAGQWGALADRDPRIEVTQRPAANRPAIIVGQRRHAARHRRSPGALEWAGLHDRRRRYSGCPGRAGGRPDGDRRTATRDRRR